MKKSISILSICGSLRSNSSNYAIVNALAALVPENIDFIRYNGLADLPAFDDSLDEPLPVTELRKQITDADGVFICTPEYAFGVPGALKNALDWTVGSGELAGKPVAVITAATGGENAHASLLLTLKALSARIADEGSAIISHVRAKLDDKGNLADAKTINILKSVLDKLIVNINNSKELESILNADKLNIEC